MTFECWLRTVWNELVGSNGSRTFINLEIKTNKHSHSNYHKYKNWKIPFKHFFIILLSILVFCINSSIDRIGLRLGTCVVYTTYKYDDDYDWQSFSLSTLQSVYWSGLVLEGAGNDCGLSWMLICKTSLNNIAPH